MSTKSEKVWVIYLKDAGVIEGTHAETRSRAIALMSD